MILGAGGPATQAEILGPTDARVGPDGLLYIADRDQNVIWRVLGDGSIELFAGTGKPGSSGNGGPADQALLDGPESMAFGPDGSLYVYSARERRIRRIGSDGTIHAFAGSGAALTASNPYVPGMTAVEAPLGAGTRLTIGTDGGVYAVFPVDHRVVRIDLEGTVTPIAGGGPGGRDAGYSGDGGPAVDALLNRPRDVAVDTAGNVFIADSLNDRIRVVRPNGNMETFIAYRSLPLELSRLRDVAQVEVDAGGLVYFVGQRDVLRVRADGSVEQYLTVAGVSGFSFSLGPLGEVYIPFRLQVLQVAPGNSGAVAVAGAGTLSTLGDGGSALNARFYDIAALAAGPSGDIFVVEWWLNRVRVVRPNGIVGAFAGTGAEGFGGDGGPATSAQLFQPSDVAAAPDGSVLIADRNNSRIRRVTPNGMIETIAGKGYTACGISTPCLDGGPAIEAPVPHPSDLAISSDNVVFVNDNNSSRDPRDWLRRISADGIIEAVVPVIVGSWPQRASAISFAAHPDGRFLVFARDSQQVEKYFYFPSATEAHATDLADYLPFSAQLEFGAAGELYAANNSILRVVSADTEQVGILLAPPSGPLADLAAIDAPASSHFTVAPDGDLYFASGEMIYRLHQPQACPMPLRPEIAVKGVRHGATYEGPPGSSPPTFVAPGQILSIFGRRLGPASLVGGQVVNGQVTTELAGVRVLVDGQPIPLLYGSEGQIGAIVPFGVSTGPSSPLQVEVDGVISEPRTIFIRDADPGLFTLDSSGAGPAAAINQDGSLNSAGNPTRPGEIVTVWGTGFGRTEPPGVDGRIVSDVLPKPVLPVTAWVGDVAVASPLRRRQPWPRRGRDAIERAHTRRPPKIWGGAHPRASGRRCGLPLAESLSLSGRSFW